MRTRQPPFIKVLHAMPDHPKIVGLSDKAFRHMVAAWCYCARLWNDGALTDAQSLVVFTKKTRAELHAAGLLDATENGWQLHNFIVRQTAAQDAADLREVRAEAGRKGGAAKANRVASATPVAKQTVTKPVPEVEVEREVEKQTTTELPSPTGSGARPNIEAQFDEFWNTYPRKASKGAALPAFVKALKRAPFEVILTGAARYRDDPHREDQFTAHPPTWLNQDRWNDDPMPPRGGPPKLGTTGQRVQQGMALYDQLKAAEDAAEQTRRELL